jgi:hypothetical protein
MDDGVHRDRTRRYCPARGPDNVGHG